MSKIVDERVVEMQFNNASFEANVKTTMTTLDRLKAALKFPKKTELRLATERREKCWECLMRQ